MSNPSTIGDDSVLNSLLMRHRDAATRLECLESKRTSYEALSRRLFSLPQRLRRTGLIPVGPRLYLPGEVIDTNHVTVLLGSGDEAYYADRTAFQARGIVQRRLARIEEEAREIRAEIGEKGKGNYENRMEGDGGRPEQGKDQDRIEQTFLSLNADEDKESKSGVWDENLQTRNEKVKGVKEEQTESGKVECDDVEPDAVPSVQVDVENGHVRKLKKRVSFREPVVTDVRWAAPTKRKAVKKKSALATALEAAKAAHEKEMREKKDEMGQGQMGQRKLGKEFKEAMSLAEKEILEGGIVNFREVYDGDDNWVEMPDGFVADEGVSFEEGSEDFLDMTVRVSKSESESTGEGTENTSEDSVTRDEYIKALLEVEKEEEIKKRREDMERAKEMLRGEARELKEFGSGFNKGFLSGGKGKSKELASSSGGDPPRVVGEDKGTVNVERSSGKKTVEERVIERVIERRVSRRSGRRRNTGRSK